MLKKDTPAHSFWYPRVEGQIRDCMYHHPEWFAGDSERMINSLSKRIVGEIVAVLVVVTSAPVVGAPCDGGEIAPDGANLSEASGAVFHQCSATSMPELPEQDYLRRIRLAKAMGVATMKELERLRSYERRRIGL